MRSFFGSIICSVAVLTFSGCAAGQQSQRADEPEPEPEPVTISGVVTDFEGEPVAEAMVLLKDEAFRDVATAQSDEDGGYALRAPRGHYMALMAVKDYQISNLQFWAWSVPAFQDMEINPRFDRLEVYALNAWQPQGSGYQSYQIYFRPMSLAMVHDAFMEFDGDMTALESQPVIDIAPELGEGDIEVSIDSQPVPVVAVNKIEEAFGPEQVMFGYVIHVPLPDSEPDGDFRVVSVTITDPDTGEKGEGWLYVPRAPWSH